MKQLGLNEAQQLKMVEEETMKVNTVLTYRESQTKEEETLTKVVTKPPTNDTTLR